ncbi:unnamed protein product [Bursaphelenchus okinawaensis]|uniref:Uncharacterized protein n=1 Tax=Bursaphelenchus okinawaensis TaxID=465554 RepID=A0A811K5R0_9BILA|nr:unnamed protein product [Bursaphelenchus okinawaensis]CAG9091848.1 unnamed protein product [Bursaphelenchus okinawaensis]
MITLSFTSIEYKERCLLKKMKVVQYYYRYDLKNLKKLRKKRAQILNETGVWIGTKEKTTAEESKKNLRQRKAEGDKATSKKLPVKEPEKVEKVEKEKSVEQVQTQPAKPKETFKSSSSSSKKKGASKESKETSKSKETKSQ